MKKQKIKEQASANECHETKSHATQGGNEESVRDSVADTVVPSDSTEHGQAESSPQEQEPTLEEKVASLEDSLLRAKADYQNLQRRAAADRSDAIRYANADLMRSLVGVVDDFDRALSSESSDEPAAMQEGLRLVYGNLMKAMEAHGLERIEALHKPFDPHVHEALMQQPSGDFPPGTVIEEIAKGFCLRDRTIRPAKVIVSTATDADSKTDSDSNNSDS